MNLGNLNSHKLLNKVIGLSEGGKKVVLVKIEDHELKLLLDRKRKEYARMASDRGLKGYNFIFGSEGFFFQHESVKTLWKADVSISIEDIN